MCSALKLPPCVAGVYEDDEYLSPLLRQEMGEVASGIGMDQLENVTKEGVEADARKLQETQAAGHVFAVIRHIRDTWIHTLRRGACCAIARCRHPPAVCLTSAGVVCEALAIREA